VERQRGGTKEQRMNEKDMGEIYRREERKAHNQFSATRLLFRIARAGIFPRSS
jgi:hypothetical protein